MRCPSFVSKSHISTFTMTSLDILYSISWCTKLYRLGFIKLCFFSVFSASSGLNFLLTSFRHCLMSCMDDREVSKTAKYANINSSEYSIGLSNWRISFRSVSFVITVWRRYI